MKTTVEIPDELYRAAKSRAALDGVRFKELVHRGLRLVLGQSTRPAKRLTFPIIPAQPDAPKLTSAKVREVEAQEDASYARAGRR